MRLFLSQTDSPPFQASVSPRRAVLGSRLPSNVSRSATDSVRSGVLIFTFPGQVSALLPAKSSFTSTDVCALSVSGWTRALLLSFTE